MSPRRPNTGVAPATGGSVAVIALDVSAGPAPSSRGSSGTSGVIRVCISETLIPAAARTAIRTSGWVLRALAGKKTFAQRTARRV